MVNKKTNKHWPTRIQYQLGSKIFILNICLEKLLRGYQYLSLPLVHFNLWLTDWGSFATRIKQLIIKDTLHMDNKTNISLLGLTVSFKNS